jgi:hypothetical protein
VPGEPGSNSAWGDLALVVAQETGAAILHYDHDYDTLAESDGVRVGLARPAWLDAVTPQAARRG